MTDVTYKGHDNWELHFKLRDNVPAFVCDHPEMVFRAESEEKAINLPSSRTYRAP